MFGQVTTPIDLISLALKTAGVIGVGQTPDAQDVSDCFTILNSMIGQWNRQRWLIWNLVDTAHLSTGAQSYTVGPTCDFDVPRPDRLEAAYARLLPGSTTNPFDFPLVLIDSHEDYAAITLKKLKTFPTSIFYDSSFPIGNVYPWPVPLQNQFEIHIVTKNTITQFPKLTTSLAMPPEYVDALIWNLSCRIRPLFQLPPTPDLIALAKAALSVVRYANAQIPVLRQPRSVLNGAGGRNDPTLGNLAGLPWSI